MTGDIPSQPQPEQAARDARHVPANRETKRSLRDGPGVRVERSMRGHVVQEGAFDRRCVVATLLVSVCHNSLVVVAA
jgi:hypothetical protein